MMSTTITFQNVISHTGQLQFYGHIISASHLCHMIECSLCLVLLQHAPHTLPYKKLFSVLFSGFQLHSIVKSGNLI